MNHRSIEALLLAVLLASCGGSGGEDPATGDDDAQTAGAETGEEDELDFEIPEEDAAGHTPGDQSAMELIGVNPPETPWGQMSHEEKEWDMIGRYQPVMSELFRRYDAERYPDIGCPSCHGADADARGYEMPPPDRLAVPPPDTDAYRQMTEEHGAELVRFMEEEVVDVGGRLLGMESNFGCNWCHPRPE